MDRESFDKKLREIILEMEEISHLSFGLYTEDGLWIGSVPQEREELGKAAEAFRDSAADSQIAYGCQFLKIFVQGRIRYILLSDVGKNMEYSFALSQMAAVQIRTLYEVMHRQEDKETSLRRLLTGELSPEEYRRKSRRAPKAEEIPFLLYVLEFDREKTETAEETIRNMVSEEEYDDTLSMSDVQSVIIKNVSGMSREECLEFAHVLVDNIQGEAMVNVRVGVGTPVSQISKLGRSYQEACTALKVCKIFYPNTQVAVSGKLGIGQLIYQLPLDLCERFLNEVFAEGQQHQLDEEMIVTVDRLFENNLNISETARQLYVHRNTLVYRLERIQKILQLDLRVFEDAMLFRIAMMVQAHVNYIKNNPGD